MLGLCGTRSGAGGGGGGGGGGGARTSRPGPDGCVFVWPAIDRGLLTTPRAIAAGHDRRGVPPAGSRCQRARPRPPDPTCGRLSGQTAAGICQLVYEERLSCL